MTATPSENKKLNPQIAEIEIGVRDLRKIKIYPLTVGPQLDLIDKFGDLASVITGAKDEETIGKILGIIRTEIPRILAQIIPDGSQADAILNEISMAQLEELIVLVFDMNFRSIVKNVQGLFGQMMQAAETIEEVGNLSKSQ